MEEKYLGVASLCRRWKQIGFVGAVEWGRLVVIATLQALVMSLIKTACNHLMPSVGANRLVGHLHMVQLPERTVKEK